MQKEPAARIWLPGQGVVDLEPMRVHRAVNAYDERLMFGRINDESHPGYGDWVIFVKMPHGEAPLPVLGFGKQIPTPEEAVRRADEANTRKHGQKLLDDFHKERKSREYRRMKEREYLAEIYADIMSASKDFIGSSRIYVPGR